MSATPEEIMQNIVSYGGGGGAGHTILDGSGTEMEQEDNLKFSNDFEVSDDSENECTEVEQHEITDLEWDEIMNLSPTPTGMTPCGFTPVGTIIAVMGKTAPSNYLACDGTVYAISRFSVLAKYIKKQFGSYNFFGGDGVDTFAVPDLRGEFLRGTGTNSHSEEGKGADVGVHQGATTFNNEFFDGSTRYSRGAADSVVNSDAFGNSGENGYYFKYTIGTKTDWKNENAATVKVRPTNTSVLYCIAPYDIYVDVKLDYSTEEKVVGTWIDSKPLYQKTINFGALPNSTTKNVAHGIQNISYVVNISGTAYNGTQFGTLPQVNDVNFASQTLLTVDSTYISIRASSDRSVWSGYITIQYTKTTD